MDTSDFYKIMNVDKSASKEEIKTAYRKLVLKYHPDKNKDPNAPEMFRKIQIAYETLSDDSKRSNYDTFDTMDNSTAVKDIFMYYQELIIETCDKYQIFGKDRQEIINLFDPAEFKEEIEKNDMITANQKLTDKIWSYIPKYLVKKFTENHPYLGSALNFIIKKLI